MQNDFLTGHGKGQVSQNSFDKFHLIFFTEAELIANSARHRDHTDVHALVQRIQQFFNEVFYVLKKRREESH